MTEDELRKFTPSIVGTFYKNAYALMLVEVYQCPICQKTMIAFDCQPGTFPRWEPLKFQNQIYRAGWTRRTFFKDEDNDYICIECLKAGKLKFTCYLCKELRDSDHIEESFGTNDERLCKICFDTVSAKKWKETCDELAERHKYDHC